MQALEVIRIAIQSGSSVDANQETYKPSMTIFAAFDNPQWRTFRLRQRRKDCIVCGENPSITLDTIPNGDYAAICVRTNPPEINERITVKVVWTELTVLTFRNILNCDRRITFLLMCATKRSSGSVVFQILRVSDPSIILICRYTIYKSHG
jgi:hypothetical protein